jgi:hypothetical protein
MNSRGRYWTVGCGERVFRLKDCLGLSFISYLLLVPLLAKKALTLPGLDAMIAQVRLPTRQTLFSMALLALLAAFLILWRWFHRP